MQREDAIAWEHAGTGSWMGFVGDECVATVRRVDGEWRWEVKREDGRLFQPNHGTGHDSSAACDMADAYWFDHLALSGQGQLLRWEHPEADVWLGFHGDLLVGRVSRDGDSPSGGIAAAINGESFASAAFRLIEPFWTSQPHHGRDYIEMSWEGWLRAERTAPTPPTPFTR